MESNKATKPIILQKIQLKRCFVCKKQYLPGQDTRIPGPLHAFPIKATDRERYKEWYEVLRLIKDPPPSALICSSHFSKDQFSTTKLQRQNHLVLLSIAVPNTNLPTGPLTAKERIKLQIEMQRAERMTKRDENKFLKNRSVAEIEQKFRSSSTNTTVEITEQPSCPTEESVDTSEELDKELYIGVTVVRKPH